MLGIMDQNCTKCGKPLCGWDSGSPAGFAGVGIVGGPWPGIYHIGCAPPEPKTEIFSADEVETVKALLEDWGFEYALTADRDKVIALARRFGLTALAESWMI